MPITILRMIAVALATLVMMALPIHVANAQPTPKKHAIVIGIGEYPDFTNLPRATNDAKDVASKLSQIGYSTRLLLNSSRRDILTEVRDVASLVRDGDTVIFYYAGHGIDIGGNDYLIPADESSGFLEDQDFAAHTMIPMELIATSLRGTGSNARAVIMILDACQTELLEGVDVTNLAGTVAPEGTVVLTSASSGQTALEALSRGDLNRNSVFARELLPLLDRGFAMADVAAQVSSKVRARARQAGHEQTPYYSSSIQYPVHLSSGEVEVAEVITRDPLVTPIETDVPTSDGAAGGVILEYPPCETYPTSLPAQSLSGRVLDRSGQGGHLDFGALAKTCVRDDTVVIDTGNRRAVNCQEIIDSPLDGLGHQFFVGADEYQLWLEIDVKRSPRSLEIGFYKFSDNGEAEQWYWVDTGVPMCNG